jgi:hypothetical protein
LIAPTVDRQSESIRHVAMPGQVADLLNHANAGVTHAV